LAVQAALAQEVAGWYPTLKISAWTPSPYFKHWEKTPTRTTARQYTHCVMAARQVMDSWYGKTFQYKWAINKHP